MTTHLIQHPMFSREQLNNRTLAFLRRGSPAREGTLTAGDPDAKGLFALMFQADAYPDPSDLARPWTEAGEPAPPPGRITVPPPESLDQATVSRIRSRASGDQCRTDLVLEDIGVSSESLTFTDLPMSRREAVGARCAPALRRRG